VSGSTRFSAAAGSVSVETSRGLYAQLEFYREYVPYMLGMTPEVYAMTTEAKITDAALSAYRRETGAPATYPIRSSPNTPTHGAKIE
jgi:hypothetical protein